MTQRVLVPLLRMFLDRVRSEYLSDNGGNEAVIARGGGSAGCQRHRCNLPDESIFEWPQAWLFYNTASISKRPKPKTCRVPNLMPLRKLSISCRFL